MIGDRDALLGWMELERVDRDIYRGAQEIWKSDAWSLYGGLVAAQALMAAARTVPEGRAPHSLHGYFLRPGDQTQPVVYRVDRDRDGRSFSARRVAATQDGQVIWEMSCSFHAPVDGPEYVRPVATDVLTPPESAVVAITNHRLLEIRIPVAADPESPAVMPVNRAWVRVLADPGEDPLRHACLHVYTSDVTTGFATLGIADIPVVGSSIDHAMWFHHVRRADEWTFYDCAPAKVGGHRGLYTGSAHSHDGSLVAIVAQEMLLRPSA